MVLNNNASAEKSEDASLLGGRAMASASPGEEIVISGLAGAFPNSSNIFEFRDNLFNKVNMVLPNRRWEYKHPEIPLCTGTLPEIDKFDAGFFGIHDRQRHSLDTMNRLMHEKVIEAILDAGMHPSDLENTNTGVYVGVCFSESDKSWFFENLASDTYALTGAERSMMAHRISYLLKVKGHSYTADTACSSSLYAFEHAFRALRLGEIETAIVGGINLCFHPFVSLQFARLGVLSKDGSCKAFDKMGNGYARSEAVGAIILQRAKDAKRIYAEVIHAKTNCDGYKEQGITFPSGPAQKALINEFYDECLIDRYSLSFLEAHGTGTNVGDPEECIAIDETLTKGRKTPLLIGSVKSNIGHSEPASGVCSITKCIIGMETGFIPPNIHYTCPRDEIKGLVEGRMKVVTEKMPFEDDRGLVGINSFGFGGGNCHILLRWNKKEKINKGLPRDNLPRLVCISGRTEEAVNSLLDEVDTNILDAEHIKLLHDGFRKKIPNHLYRGYTLVSKSGGVTRSVKYSPENSRPLYFAFGELNNWYDVGRDLMALPVFVDTIRRVEKHLSNKGFSITDSLLNKLPVADINDVVGSIAVQMGIIDLLNLLEVKPTGIFGFSFGELLCAYYDGLLNLEEVVDCAAIINESVNKLNDLYKSNKISSQVSHSVNGTTGVTNGDSLLNGSKSKLENFKIALKANNSADVKEYLIKNLTAVLGKYKNGNLSNGRYRSADYFINALTNGISHNSEHISLHSTVLNIGSGGISDDVEDVVVISFPNSKAKDYLIDFLTTVGRLYEAGCNPQISELYPPVEFPVSRGTRMISPYIKWRHTRTHFFPEYTLEVKNQAQQGARMVKVQLTDHEWSYIDGHVIDGRNLFPATGYLYLVWETYAIMGAAPMSVMNVIFENCKFIRATTIPKKGYLTFSITIQKGTGNFEVAEGDSAIVTGRIYVLKNNESLVENDVYNNTDYLLPSARPLTSKDVYKELRLRGYNYRGGFRGIQQCDNNGSKGYIKWDDNWVTFMDNMLQMKILQTDTRLLYVPTYITKLTISAKKHLEWINREYINVEKSPNLPVFCDQATNVVRCGGIMISGLIASSIPRKKILALPVLESYKFVPNYATLNTEESVRVNIQIILENALVYRVKAAEVIDEYTKKDVAPLSPIIHSVVEDQPLVQPLVKILSKTPLDVAVEVDDRKLKTETDCLLVIASSISARPELLSEAFISLKENGFIISRERRDFDTSRTIHPDLTLLTAHRSSSETLLLLQRQSKVKQSIFIKINSSDDFSWIPTVQEAIKMKFNEDIVLYSENEPNSGLLGLVNCMRMEPDGRCVRGIFVMDKIDESNKEAFYREQLRKNLALNVYKNGQWGTYRHLLLNTSIGVESEHCFVNVTVRGDLSSLRWIAGPLRQHMTVPAERELIHVYYAALNFRDIMTASGKINADVVTKNRLEQECVQGFEFSGRDTRGNRIMGMVTYGALSSLILADKYLCFKVPDSWTLEEATTVPVVYGTIIYGMLIRGQLQRGETILIHSGTGGIGQAAIRLALHYGCRVYTTVGTQEKRDFLKKTYPQLKDRHIGNSRDESFEQLIYRETKGRGVDMVLNSLAEDKLLASVRCLAKGGRFIEIGKFDMANNSYLSLLLLQKEASFQGVMLDQLFTESPDIKKQIVDILIDGVACGAIKPLSKTTFKFNEIEQAFRFMTTGKHMGKVLIEVRKPERDLIATPSIRKFSGIARYFCDPEKTYIIIGGLGGFGMELADWLVLRGARKLVLTSRKGISTGYQSLRIRILRSYGTVIRISKDDVTTEAGCKQLIEDALQLGPVDAIFNLAVVLADAIFENQTPESFVTSFKPKATATHYLDEITRKLCPDLRDFVVFSSVSCGRGNAGQTNYGMANSVMERICEKRKQDGYPALAIEWGAVGDVGLVADMQEEQRDLEISGTLQQQISNCLQVLDTLLRQNEAPIVSSMVVAEKRGGVEAAENIVDSVINILGLNDVKCVSLHSTLAELGMDSMTAVEIKQTLEREYEVFLSAKDIRTMTLARLKGIQEQKSGLGQMDADIQDGQFGIETVLRIIGDQFVDNIPYKRLTSNVDENAAAPTVLLFPGVEGNAKVFETLASRLNAHTICLQFRYDDRNKTIMDIVNSVMPYVNENVSKEQPFYVIAYSYGSSVALEVVNILELQGYTGKVICLDGAPVLMKAMLKSWNTGSTDVFETGLLCHLLSFYTSSEIISKHKENIFKCKTWEERLTLAVSLGKHMGDFEENNQRIIANGIYQRLKALAVYSPSYSKLNSEIKLYKPKSVSIQGLPEDYNLSLLREKPVEIQVFEGNHFTFLENETLAKEIDASINQRDQIQT